MGNNDDEEQNDLGNETKSMEKKIDKVKKTLKKAAKFMIKHWKFTLIIVAIIIVILLLLVAASYVLKIIDGTEDSDDDSNVPASVSSYTSSTSVNDEGELTVDSTVQELWDELVEEDSRVSEYLDSAEELAKLINAELITQNVDTREDPDEEIDWDKVIEEMTGTTSSSEEDDDETTDIEESEVTSEENEEEETTKDESNSSSETEEDEDDDSESGYSYVTTSNYVVNTELSAEELVIDNVSDLKTAFENAGGAGTDNLVANASYFLQYQNEYKVNAIFAAAVAINECGAGTNLKIGGNNWFSIKSKSGGWKSYATVGDAIEGFYWQIADGSYYFKQGKYNVYDIGMTYCTNADKEGGWIDSVTGYMKNMYAALGIYTIDDGSTSGLGTTSVQGIIKFKRVTSDKTDGETMSYVDYDTFYGWIDEYESGETGVLDDLLTHFTLETTTTTTSTSSTGSSTTDETDTVSGETMKWPTDGTTITSEFGTREAPTEGASTDHKGIDISVSEGTNVYATEAGTVSYVDTVRNRKWRDICYNRSWKWIRI